MPSEVRIVPWPPAPHSPDQSSDTIADEPLDPPPQLGGRFEMPIRACNLSANRESHSAKLGHDRKNIFVGDIITKEKRPTVGEWLVLQQAPNASRLVDTDVLHFDNRLSMQDFYGAWRQGLADLLNPALNNRSLLRRQAIVWCERIALVLDEDPPAQLRDHCKPTLGVRIEFVDELNDRVRSVLSVLGSVAPDACKLQRRKNEVELFQWPAAYKGNRAIGLPPKARKRFPQLRWNPDLARRRREIEQGAIYIE